MRKVQNADRMAYFVLEHLRVEGCEVCLAQAGGHYRKCARSAIRPDRGQPIHGLLLIWSREDLSRSRSDFRLRYPLLQGSSVDEFDGGLRGKLFRRIREVGV